MNLGNIEIVLHLLMKGEQEQNKLSEELGFSKQHISLMMKDMEKKGFISRYKQNRRYVVNYNGANPLVKELNRLVLLAANQKQIIDILSERNSLKTLSCFTDKSPISRKELIKSTGYERRSLGMALRSLEDKKIIYLVSKKPSAYVLNKKNTAGVSLWHISKLIYGSPVDIDRVIKHITNDDHVIISVLYGSAAKNKADEYSDVDLFVVVDTPADRERLLSKYSHLKLDLNVFSKGGFIQMLDKEPHFLKLVKEGRILKGDEMVKALITD